MTFHYIIYDMFPIQVSGLSAWVSESLGGLQSLSPWIVVMVLSIMVAIATEVTSNAATTTLFIPIVGNLVSFPFY